MYLKLIGNDIFSNKGIPYYNFISISNICNANCIFCDVHDNKDKFTRVDINDLLLQLSTMGAKYVHFTGGGEPFANKEIFSYLDNASKLGLNICITTNGTLLNEKIIEKFKKYNIKAMFFSIDSYEATCHDKLRKIDGAFEKAINNINYIKKLYPSIKIVINCVLQKSNIDYIYKMIDLKKKVNYDFLNPIIIKDCPELYFSDYQILEYCKNNYQKKIKNFDLLYDDINYFEKGEYDENGSDFRKNSIKCQCLNYISFVDCVSGQVYPCDCSIHRDKEFYSIGNLLKNSFCEIWNSKKAEELRKTLYLNCTSCKSKCDGANVMFNKYYG